MMIIAVDFDGTLAEHRFPDIGPEVPGAIEWCKAFQKMGARLILLTMRSDGQQHGNVLSDALGWCADRGLVFWAVNNNPEQRTWTLSPKVYANIYIDDAAAGCPLKESAKMDARPYVDWKMIGPTVERTMRGD